MFPEGLCNMVHCGVDCVRCKAIKSFKGKSSLLDCAGKAAEESVSLEAIKTGQKWVSNADTLKVGVPSLPRSDLVFCIALDDFVKSG
jgi:hypothetical protein